MGERVDQSNVINNSVISNNGMRVHYALQGWKLTLARGELNSVRASGLSDLTSPVGEWEFYGDLSIIS